MNFSTGSDAVTSPPAVGMIRSTTRNPPRAEENSELLSLVTKGQAGDLGAQSALVRLYSKRLSAFVRPIISRPEAVEDVVQMAFIKMVRRLHLLRDPPTFESWLFMLTRNAALDFIRRTRCRPQMILADEHYAQTPDSHNAQAMLETTEVLEFALQRLNPRDREIVRSIVQGGATYLAVARREGLTLGAVKLRLHRARLHLRAGTTEAIGFSAYGRRALGRESRGKI